MGHFILYIMIYNCFYTCTLVATPYNIDKPLIRARPIMSTSTSSRPCVFLRLLAAVVDAFLHCDDTLLNHIVVGHSFDNTRLSDIVMNPMCILLPSNANSWTRNFLSPELWMCGHRALYVLSGIELTSFLQVLETSPCRGGSAEILYL
jgi:hypothetical protein